jgi:hypothetical protein
MMAKVARVNFQDAVEWQREAPHSAERAASFSRRVLRPSHSADARSENKSEGARDAARSRGPAEIPEKNPQVRLLSSVPRAVFEAFLRMAPGG